MTTSELLSKVELGLEAENIYALHCYYHAACHNKAEIEEYWVTEDKDVSWKQGFGARDSLARLYLSYALNSRCNCLTNYECVLQVFPQVADKDPCPLHEMAMHTLTSPIVEVADDLQSVKAWWYTPGTISSNLNYTRRQEGSWIWERYGIDFKLEGDELKIQRASVLADIMFGMDSGDWSIPRVRGGHPEEEEEECEFNPVTTSRPYEVPGPFHYSYAPTQMPQDDPPCPVPYATMSETFRY